MAVFNPPPMSNNERQRKFRERNPSYYARLQATRRASAKRGAEQMILAIQAAAAEELAKAEAVAQQQVVREPLLLPAPKEKFGLPWEIARPAAHEAERVEVREAF